MDKPQKIKYRHIAIGGREEKEVPLPAGYSMEDVDPDNVRVFYTNDERKEIGTYPKLDDHGKSNTNAIMNRILEHMAKDRMERTGEIAWNLTHMYMDYGS